MSIFRVGPCSAQCSSAFYNLTYQVSTFLFLYQEYTTCLNEFRVKMRSSHLKQTESQVSVEVTQVSEAYHELLNRANRLADRFLRVGSKSKVRLRE